MDLRQEIFNEVRRLKLDTGDWWTFQHYIHFDVCPMARFLKTMEELCNEGIFEIVEQIGEVPPSFALTQKGADLVWGN